MKRPCLTPMLVVCLAVASSTFAAQRVVVLDPSASSVSFTLDTTFHVVHGTMVLSGGTIRFDPKTGEASGTITVDARRAETGNTGRDKNMHTEVLESSLYPTIVFALQRVEGTLADSGRSELRLVGVMTLHGADHPMTLTASVETAKERVRGEMRFPVPYVEWGLKDPSLLVVRAAKTVDLVVRVEGRLDDGAVPR